jgi:hypothetical protein
MNVRPRVARMLLLSLLSAVTGSASALSYTMMKDRDLLAQSPLLLRATVIKPLAAARGPAGIESVYALRLHEQFKGGPLSPTVRLALPGGVLPSGIGEAWFGVPTLREGQTLLLFAEQRGDGLLIPEQLTLGLFLEGTHAGKRYYHRAIDGAGDLSAGANAKYHRPRDAAAFEQWLSRTLRGETSVPSYLVDTTAAPALSAKFNLLLGNNGNAVRWFQFDTNTALNWVSTAAGQAGMVQDEFAMITAAANALTNDAGSKLTVTHSGGTIASPDTHCDNGTSDGHAVLWNDPFGAIGGSYNCASGGVLAVGGPCFFETSTISNGQPYNSAFEGRIQVQDNAGCYFDGDAGKDGQEVMIHEMGHVVGLEHSCGDAQSGPCASATAPEQVATMRALAHSDGRGAALRPDDQAALAFVYPSGVSNVIFTNGFE